MYNLNNSLYNSHYWLCFTMTSMTTTMIYINTTSSIFYGQTIFTMICNNSVNLDDYINNKLTNEAGRSIQKMAVAAAAQ